MIFNHTPLPCHWRSGSKQVPQWDGLLTLNRADARGNPGGYGHIGQCQNAGLLAISILEISGRRIEG